MGRGAEAEQIFREMHRQFGAEAGSPLANKIGMTSAYEAAKARLHEVGLI